MADKIDVPSVRGSCVAIPLKLFIVKLDSQLAATGALKALSRTRTFQEGNATLGRLDQFKREVAEKAPLNARMWRESSIRFN